MADFLLSSSGAPLVRRKNGHVWWEPTDFLAAGHVAQTTRRTYAGYVCDLLSQMEVDGKEWNDLSDIYFGAYEHALAARGVADCTRSEMLRVQLDFLFFMQDCGNVCDLIGPEGNFRVTASRESGSLKSDLIPRRDDDGRKVRPPSRDAIEIVKSNAPFRSDMLAERLEIMMDWGLVNLRACETCALTVQQIPKRDYIKQLLEANRSHPVTLIRTKGDKRRTVDVLPTLLMRTRDWIDADRQEIVKVRRKTARAKGEKYEEPAEIFLSRKTGQAIGPVTYSNQVRAGLKASVKAGQLSPNDRVWPHGLRHEAISHELKRRRDGGQRNAALIVASESGHGSLQAMQPYVHGTEHEFPGPWTRKSYGPWQRRS